VCGARRAASPAQTSQGQKGGARPPGLPACLPCLPALAKLGALPGQSATHAHAPAVGRTIKVFHAGVRWGIVVPRKGLKSRQQLARALNEGMAGQIASTGRGEGLAITFVDKEVGAPPLAPGHLPCSM